MNEVELFFVQAKAPGSEEWGTFIRFPASMIGDFTTIGGARDLIAAWVKYSQPKKTAHIQTNPITAGYEYRIIKVKLPFEVVE